MSTALAHALNESCFCVSVDRPALDASFRDAVRDADAVIDLIASRPHLVAGAPVFLSSADATAMTDVVRAVEGAARLPEFRDAALAHAPPVAQKNHGPAGAFMGYDFHLTDEGPKLIEINTNAGGAFLNAFLARAQRVCCGTVAPALAEVFESAVINMFEGEWRRQRGKGRPRRIAIVDDAPTQQYLYPEFILAQALLAHAGFDVAIVDARDLRYEQGALRHSANVIDLVYNRLVDFTLNEPAHAALREAYLAGAVVVTPNPHIHRLYADKRNLTLLSDTGRLASWGLPQEQIRQLQRLPITREVTPYDAEALWAERGRYFFKPVAGYGGKAVYRGDKLTRRAWESIRAGGYVAQERASPSECIVRVGQEARACKLDVRLYTYEGNALLWAARVYQGQTTNFRTPGGGFAPVLVV